MKQVCLVVGLILSASAAHAESKRAVLIGINCYNPVAAECANLYQTPETSALKRPFTGNWLTWQYDNLTGAVSDVELMKSIVTPLGFSVVTLTDEHATAEAILTTLQHNLVDDAKSGDTRLVYYSGHGNFVRNTASKESDGYDQTIVPADHFRNVADVRDKELSRILFAAGSKGVKVIFIADSCHSGSISRGAWNARRTKTARSGSATGKDSPAVDDSWNRDPATVGVITFSAAQRSESAQEVDIPPNTDGEYPFGQSHGAFTWALKTALDSGLNQSLETLNRRVAALMQANNLTQVPAIDGKDRSSRTLFGDKADDASTQTVIVEGMLDPKTLEVRGGQAIGIYPGTQLKRLDKKRPAVEIEITENVGVALSKARVVEPKAGDFEIESGELFEVDKWVVPMDSQLKIYLPPTAPEAVVFKTAAEISKLKSDSKIHWLDDPTLGHPNYVMNWSGKGWTLDAVPTRIEIKDAKGKVTHVQSSPVPPPVNLGTLPTAGEVRQQLSDGATFLLILPPTDVMLDALSPVIQRLSKAITPMRTQAGAQYWLAGRIVDDKVKYAWIVPDATEADVQSNTKFQLPIRSDWVLCKADDSDSTGRAANEIMDKAQRIAKLREWLVLPNPPENFPYQLTFREMDTNHYVNSGDLLEGKKYKMYLQAPAARLKNGVSARWVYIFAIDQYGKGVLLFPALGHGNEDNQLPRKSDTASPLRTLVALNGERPDEDFTVGEPFGVDTYIMLTTEQPIDNPEIFEFDGPRTSGSRGASSSNPLESLLSGIGSASRSPLRPVPSNWNIQRLTMRSVPLAKQP